MRLLVLAALALMIVLVSGYAKMTTEKPYKTSDISHQKFSLLPKPEIKKMRGSTISLKQKTKMILKEKKQKDGTRTLKFKKVRKVGPPFNEYLEGPQRQELLELIKTSRAVGKTQDEVRETIDLYLKSHLSAEKLAQVEKLKAEGARRERERLQQIHQALTDGDHQYATEDIAEQRQQQHYYNPSTRTLKYRSVSKVVKK